MSRAGWVGGEYPVVLPDRGTVAHGFVELKPHYKQMNKRLRVGDIGWTPQNFGAYISRFSRLSVPFFVGKLPRDMYLSWENYDLIVIVPYFWAMPRGTVLVPPLHFWVILRTPTFF